MNKLRFTIIAFMLSLLWHGSFVSANDVTKYNVTWQELGIDENSSMPIGNGDVAANVWTEQNGDIVVLISKTDAWDENARLLKVGRLRIKLTPNPFVGVAITQSLDLQNGCITLKSGDNSVTIWVDANSPVIRVKSNLKKEAKISVDNEMWRTEKYHLTQQQINKYVFNMWSWNSNPNGIDCLPDQTIATGNKRIAWCHYNTHSMYPVVLKQEHLESLIGKYEDPLLHRCFGAMVEGNGFKTASDKTLVNEKAKESLLNVYVYTAENTTTKAWFDKVNVIAKADTRKKATAWNRHAQWWKDFWNRSWIEITGSADAEKVSQSYAINRYMTACAGRGKYPIKFNGSIFTVGHDIPAGTISTADNHDPDFRDWGSCYWHQNCRHIYWPLIASGDFDMLMPWFNMYVNALPLAKDRTKLYYNHGGASFIETMHFWGLPNLNDFGWDNPNNDPQSPYMRWHTQNAIETVTQMLDTYDITQDKDFLNNKLLPLAESTVQYYNEHWKRGDDGKIYFSPIQSIEMYQGDGVVNSTPDIAGLYTICSRLANIKDCTASQQSLWKEMLRDLPAIPVGTTQGGQMPLKGNGDADGLSVYLPAQIYGAPSNEENPELYTVFPYRNTSLGKPTYQLGVNTFYARRYPMDICWGQDGMEAALLGLTPFAKKAAVNAFTQYGPQKFPWFWAKIKDYCPDMDNGGTGSMTLQLMLMQTQGDTIRLLPAWPEDWNATFKLHAPKNTTVEGTVAGGKIVNLKVTPESRAKDVIMPKKPIRISCIGASITEGYGTTDWNTMSYPGQLQTLLGNDYHVENYGRGGCTMLRKGDMPYIKYEKYKPSLRSNPDIVFIDLGGNDAKLRNRIHKDEFIKDACDLVKIYQDLPTHPRVILLTAIPGFTNDSTEIWDTAIVRDINPLIIQAAKKANVEVIDMHPLLAGRGELFKDGIHPDNEGAGIMARFMADYLKKNPACALVEYGDKDMKNYQFSFEARNRAEAGQVQIWAAFRQANKYDRYVLGIKGGLLDEVFLMRQGYMGADELMAVRPLAFHPKEGEWLRAKVEAVGNRIRVFIGDEPLPYIDITDKNNAAVQSGNIALGLGWLATEYRNVQIKTLSSDALANVSDKEFNRNAGFTPEAREAKRKLQRKEYHPIEIASLNPTRTEISLDGNWLFLPDYETKDIAKNVDPTVGDDSWHVMNVPDFWVPIRIWLHGETMPSPRGSQPKGVSDKYYFQETQRCEELTFHYNKTQSATYRQWITLPKKLEGKKMVLHFDAVSKTAEVYVNGKLAGSHIGMFGDFQVDVTKLMHPGKNLIAVKVLRSKGGKEADRNKQLDAHYAAAQNLMTQVEEMEYVPEDIINDMPHGFYDGNPAGIWQPVKLIVTQQQSIGDVFITPTLTGASFDINCENCNADAAKGMNMQVSIRDHKTGEELGIRSVELGMISNSTLSFTIDGLKPKLWSPEHPNLYDFTFSLTNGKKIVDKKTITSGFRTFEAKNGYLYLNGKQYWLRGGNHVPSAICPNDRAVADSFFTWMKRGHIDVTRTHTAPFNELWMKAADEIGIGVSFEGTWPWLMLENRPIPQKDLLNLWKEEWKQLMRKMYNHPSLIMWTINNEMKFYDLDSDKQRAMQKMTVMSDVVKEMREIEPIRPIVYDSNYFRHGKEEKYGKQWMDGIDDGDIDDVHAYYNWYDFSFFRFFKGEFQRDLKYPGRPLISQELSTGYPNNETGHPVHSYQIIHQNPMSLIGYLGYDYADPNYFLNTLSFTTSELAEALRRTGDQCSGFMHFSLLTWFQQPYNAKEMKPNAVYYGLKKALQPVLVSAELWGRHAYAGTPLTTQFYVINDREDGSDLQPSRLTWSLEWADNKTLAAGEMEIPAVKHSTRYSVNPNITLPSLLPADKLTAKLKLALLQGHDTISTNSYDLLLAKPLDVEAKINEYKDVKIIENSDSLNDKQLAELHDFVAQGGKLLLLNSKEAARQLYPEYIKGWIEPTEGDVCFMEDSSDDVFTNIHPMDLRYFNNNLREMPKACHFTLKTERNDNVDELIGQMKIHAYIDGGKPEARQNTINKMRGFPLVRIHEGRGSVYVSTMATDKWRTDPVAAQLLINMIEL